jgi:uncharacterized protein (DUF3820 family)
MAREYKPLPDLTDDDLMPSGKHKGEKMQNVPASYLLYVYDSNMVNYRVRKYIEDNLDVIKQQAKKEKE